MESAEPIELTNDELLAAPPKLLTREQRRKRRRLKNDASKARTRQRRRKAREAGVEKRIFCIETKRDGSNCAMYAVIGSDRCYQHLTDEEREKFGMIRKPSTGPGQRLTAPQLALEVVETAVVKILKPYTDALGLEIIGLDEHNQPIVRDLGPDAGLMLHGESKDGDIVMTHYPDLGGRVQIAEKLQDRVYGRPRQTTILEGGTKPVQVQPVRTIERSQEMARLMSYLGMASAALPPGGTSDGDLPDDTIEGEVVPLNGSDRE